MTKSDNTNKVSFGKMRSLFFFSTLILLTITFLYLFKPFAYTIFWAGILAVLFYPLYIKIKEYIKNSALSSILSIVVILLFLFIPLIILVLLLLEQTIELYGLLAENPIWNNPWIISDWIKDSSLAPIIDLLRYESGQLFLKIADWASTFLVNSITNVTKNSLKLIIHFFIMIYTLFFFLRDGESFLKKIMHFSPLGDVYEKMLYGKFISTTKAELKSTFIVGGIQGFLGAVLFAIVGIKAFVVWGVIMMIAAIIPALGTPIITVPAAIIMFLTGNIWQGVVLTVGAIFIGTIDNLIRPPLVGKDIELHPLIVFFSTLGGLLLFGISGFVVGPIIASLYISFMSIYEHYYRNELQNN
jgi:predicted PurR-regulated permease PerM